MPSRAEDILKGFKVYPFKIKFQVSVNSCRISISLSLNNIEFSLPLLHVIDLVTRLEMIITLLETQVKSVFYSCDSPRKAQF